ncbi:MAG: hypothetical protein EZS28_050738, partial [Streblomastix strix]
MTQFGVKVSWEGGQASLQDLKDCFQPMRGYMNIRMYRAAPGSIGGKAFVSFRSKQDAENALTAQGLVIGGSVIDVPQVPIPQDQNLDKKTLHITNINPRTT